MEAAQEPHACAGAEARDVGRGEAVRAPHGGLAGRDGLEFVVDVRVGVRRDHVQRTRDTATGFQFVALVLRVAELAQVGGRRARDATGLPQVVHGGRDHVAGVGRLVLHPCLPLLATQGIDADAEHVRLRREGLAVADERTQAVDHLVHHAEALRQRVRVLVGRAGDGLGGTVVAQAGDQGPAGPGVLGLGGLGHMAVKFAASFGAEVTMLSHSPSKEADAKRLGAARFALTSNADTLKGLVNYFDFIIDTVSAPHDYNMYLNLLNTDGVMICVGAPPAPAQVPAFNLIGQRRSIAGSLIGGIPETQEMLDYCAEHNIVSDVEIIDIKDINEAYERMMKGDVKYRFVIDMATL